MTKYITALEVSTNSDEEQALRAKGFHQITVDLNTGSKATNSIYLWYKKGDVLPVTRVQVTFNSEMEEGLKNYTKIDNDLNTGTPGGPLHMWYSTATGDNDIPIVDVTVTTDASSEMFYLQNSGEWEKVSCNLNFGAGGNFVYAWVKRATPFYICDVTVTDRHDQDQKLFKNGYTRVDVNTNLGVNGATEVFIWYRKTKNEGESLSALNISTNDTQKEEMKGFTMVNTNLNENSGGNDVYLWFKKEQDLHKVRGLVLLLNQDAVEKYKGAKGATLIERNLNTGNSGTTIYMCQV